MRPQRRRAPTASPPYSCGVGIRVQPGRMPAANAFLVLALTATGISSTYIARTAAPNPPAARFFTTDPAWSVHTPGSGTPDWVASAVRAPGLEFVGSLPPVMANAVREVAARHTDSAVWTSVTTLRHRDGQHYNIPEVFVASSEGIVQPIAPSTLPLPLLYQPAIQVLPARIAMGEKWSQLGRSSYAGIEITSYTAESEITKVGNDGCVEVRSRTTLTPTDDGSDLGATPLDDTNTTTYCPGEWSVRTTGGSGDQQTVDAADAVATMADFAAPQANAGSDLASGTDTLFTRPTPGAASTDPLVMPSADVVLDAEGASQVMSAVVADGPLAFPVWRVPAAAPFIAAPIQAGKFAVLADSAGVVTGVEPATGFVHWQVRLDKTIRKLATEPEGRLVGVLDALGRITVLDVETGARVAQVQGAANDRGLAMPDGGLVVSGGEGGLRGVRIAASSAADSVTFTTGEALLAGPVVTNGRLVVATDRGEVVAYSLAGDELARRYVGFTSVDALTAGDGVVALSGRGRITFLDDALNIIGQQDGSAGALTVGTSASGEPVVTATAADGTLRVFGRDGQLVWRGHATVQTPTGPSVLKAAALTVDGVTYVSSATGVERFAGDSR